MPRRIYRKRTSARRTYRKSRKSITGRSQAKPSTVRSIVKNQGQVVRVNASRAFSLMNVIAPEFYTTHRYVSNTMTLVNNAASGLNGSSYYFRLNSLYAPDFSGGFGPHQPYQYDQMRSLYNKSCVFKVKVTVKLINAAGSVANGLILFQKNGSDVADPVGETVTQWQEKPNAQVLVATNISSANNEAFGPIQVWEGTFDIAQLYGVTRKDLLTDQEYSSAGNSNPSGIQLFGLSMGDYRLTPGVGATVIVQLDYQCRWTDPVTNPSS